MGKYILRILIVAVGWLTMTTMNAEDSGYYIRRWDYDATVHADNTMDIVERLDVTFNEPRHGIYHYLNTRYYDGHIWNGKEVMFTYSIDVSDIEVEGDEYITEHLSRATNIRIGSADYTIIGDKTYVIRYRLTYPDDRCTDYDQIFHSVMAADVTTHTDCFTFRMNFDKPLPDDVVSRGVTVYSGAYEYRKNKLNVQCDVTPTCISGMVENLPAENAITLFAYLPEGYYENPASVPAAPFWVLFVLTIVFLAWIVYDLMVNRRRKKPVTVVNFYPPQGISSAEVGTIIDDSADVEDLTSLIPWLAHQGYIQITEQPDKKGRTGKHATLTLTLLKDIDSSTLPEYAKEFLYALFDKKADIGTSIDMEKLKDISSQMDKAKKSLAKEFKGGRKLTKLSGACILPYLAGIMIVVTIAFSSRITLFESESFLASLCSVMLSMIVFGCWSIGISASAHIESKGSKIFRWIVIIIVGLGAFGIWYAIWEPQDSFMPMWAGQLIFALMTLVMLLMGRYNADTPYRTEMMGQLLGLREFIKKAEQPRLKMLVDEDPSYFYGILPFAMVFGLSDKWAKLFKDIEMQQPTWFASPTPLMATQALTSAINDSIETMHQRIAEHSVPPNSGGNGGHVGGGFSGGGGGGGGTGSW